MLSAGVKPQSLTTVKLDAVRSNVYLLFSVKTTCAERTVQYAVRCLLILVSNKSSGFRRQRARGYADES
jgi:hypothetical protein